MSTRLPVRLGLGDPRLQNYMISAKPTPSSSSATAATAASSSYGRQDRIPAVGVTAPRGSYPSETVRSGISSSSISNSHHRAIPPFHPPSSSSSAPDQSSSRTYPQSPSTRQTSISQSNSGQWNDDNAAAVGGRHSTSPGSQPRSLPSPTPSMTPMSPDCRHSHDPSHQQQHPQQHRTHQQHDLLSPLASEIELGSDTKPLTPLFRSNSPPAYNSMSHRPSSSTSHLGPAHMTNSLSATSNGSAGVSGVVHPSPALDRRAVTPPATSLGWSAKHHHHRIPVRSPDRADHELLTTSTNDSEPSAYMNMNFYDIYRQNPSLLRPEGGRHEERRLQAFHHHQANPHYHTHPHPDGAYPGDYSRPIGHAKRSSAGGLGGLSRRQSMPLISTATQRVLRHEDAKVEQQMSYDEHVDDMAMKQDPNYHYHSRHHGLGIQQQQQQQSTYAGAYKHTSVIPSVQARPAPMSIHHILSDDTTHGSEQDRFSFRSDDDDDEETDRYSETMGLNYGYRSGAAPYSSSSKASQKRKQDENDSEPKKRKRISKKQAAEMGLLGPEGVVKRKRTKKIREPGYVSPTGFSHGGERVVQEPEEVVVLEPDVGPVSILDNQSLPKIIWKGYPLNISGKIGFELLHPYEVHIASTLRLSPAQYLACKRTLILASRKYLSVPNGKQFKKSDAQKLCRIDVNKTSRLWEIFAKVGWLAGITEQDL
ncbi:hypothetical protein EC957_010436 [Mortierella hygrophila]|uniref:SWIRM domain-containing protein n=1 Tax=Mortierella hygrophila TaxID=979708 RepID=A0A9P6FAD5_9FUNG|nr:hypothetical protein EC957_010436 [Mortierella hygrophila]